MPGLDPGIHSGMPVTISTVTEWIAGSSLVKPGNDDIPEVSRPAC
jgi:hypothetical protein